MLHKEEVYGLHVIKEIILKCKDCNTPLVNIVLSEDNANRAQRGLMPMKTKYKVVNCIRCDSGSTFESEVFEGSTAIYPAKDGFFVEDEDTVIDDNEVIVSSLRVRKN